MAQKPSKTQGAKTFNIMERLRGNFDFSKAVTEQAQPVAYGTPELLSLEQKTKILNGSLNVLSSGHGQNNAAGSLLNIVQRSFSKVGQDRVENRKILDLMPDVEKAARLVISSIFSPNDLSRHELAIAFNNDAIQPTAKLRLEKEITTFFQDRLNLKASAPKWVYQFGYETGSSVFAIIPMKSFAEMHDASFLGTEAFVKNVVDPMATESLFGFSDSPINHNHKDIAALETFTNKVIETEEKIAVTTESTRYSDFRDGARKIVEQMIATEALSLTDNPSVLHARKSVTDKQNKKIRNKVSKHYGVPRAETMVSISSDRDLDKDKTPLGDPIMMRIPSESVTVIHTPGDPNDHQGYFVFLDTTGNPIDVTDFQNQSNIQGHNYNQTQGNIFAQIHSAYGIDQGFHGISDKETMARIYSQVIQHHLLKRLDTIGFGGVSTSNMDAALRCMFGRFMQQKQTRVLFLPKELVTYMAFELDENGVGISRLEKIKFILGMKMAVQVSRVLASIKAAMDNRKIEVKFGENNMETPEGVIQSVINQYSAKSRINFTTDPNVIQSQIADKSLSIRALDVPGMDSFDITNEADNKTSSVDFDSGMSEYLDKQINNGMHVPASAMNSLGEDEYSRSVATSNLFFAADIGIDQDIVVKHLSDLIKTYARYSESFRQKVIAIFPQLDTVKTKGTSSTDDTKVDTKEVKEGDDHSLPEGFTIDQLIDAMSISLPKPNVAPSKAQFEALEAMSTAITNMVTALFPDDLAGSDDALKPAIALLRAKFIAQNIKSYLDSSGMSGLKVPENNFSSELKDVKELHMGLQNVLEMINDNTKLTQPSQPDQTDPGTGVPGY